MSHRTTKRYTPHNGLAQRFNGHVQSKVLGISIDSHADLDQRLAGFSLADNRRRRVLQGKSPSSIVAERLQARPELASSCYKPPPEHALEKATAAAEHTNEAAQPDTRRHWQRSVR